MSDTSPKDAVKPVAWIVTWNEPGGQACHKVTSSENEAYRFVAHHLQPMTAGKIEGLVPISALSQVRKQERKKTLLEVAKHYACRPYEEVFCADVVEAIRKLAEE